MPTAVQENAAIASSAGEDLVKIRRMPDKAITWSGVGEAGKKNFACGKAFYLTRTDEVFARGFAERVISQNLIPGKFIARGGEWAWLEKARDLTIRRKGYFHVGGFGKGFVGCGPWTFQLVHVIEIVSISDELPS